MAPLQKPFLPELSLRADGDAGRVAGKLGNSAAVVHRHYRELVKPADAERWFAVKPENPANVLALPAAANA